MKSTWGVGLVSACLAACGGGGGAKGASTAAASSGDSQITMAFPAGDDGSPAGKVDFSGLAFSQYDPDAKALLIYVLDPATQPAPSCDNVGLAAMMKQKSGTVAAIVIKDFEGKATKIKAGLGLFAQGDTSKLQTPPSAPLDATDVDITTYDAKTIEATITTDASAKATVTGKIHGTVCPNTSMQKQAQQVQDDQMAKMQASGGAGVPPMMTTTEGAPSYQVAFGDTISVVDSSKSLVKVDPKTKMLVVGSWTPNLPAPTCDNLAAPAKTPATEGGTIHLLYAKGVTAHAPGKFSVVAEQAIVVGDPSSPKPQATALVGNIDIHTFDDKTFTADVMGENSVSLSGNIAATVCPNGHIDAPAEAKSAKSGKPSKKKK